MSVRGAVALAANTAASGLRPSLSLKPPPDPGFAALRRSARAAIVIPQTLLFGEYVLHDTQNIIFIVFGGFALLVMSNFGGRRRPRAIAYLTATLVGAVLIALGTLVSQNTALAAVMMLVVGFTIAFASMFGGYVAAAQTGMLLAFVIAVTARSRTTWNRPSTTCSTSMPFSMRGQPRRSIRNWRAGSWPPEPIVCSPPSCSISSPVAWAAAPQGVRMVPARFIPR